MHAPITYILGGRWEQCGTSTKKLHDYHIDVYFDERTKITVLLHLYS